jgi:prolyl oligopeptidase
MSRSMSLILSIISAAVLALYAASAQTATLSYPATKKVNHVDTYFGTRVSDPYRWLEDDTARAVAEWVAAENVVTNQYLSAIPYRGAILKRLEEIYNYPKYSTPFRKLGYYVYSKNDGLQNQSVVFIQKGEAGTPEVFIDPNTFSADGTSRLATLSFSKDMKYAAYGISKGGSDWNDIYVIEVASRTLLADQVRWTKFSGVAWKGAGFYYSRYDAPTDTTKALSASNENQKVYYHLVGTPQSEDQLIYADPAHPKSFHNIGTSEDERFEFLTTSDRGAGRRGNTLAVRDTKKGEKKFHPIINTFDDTFRVIDHVDGMLYIETDNGAPNGRIILVDPRHPDQASWKVIVPEGETPLKSTNIVCHKLVISDLKDVATRLFIYDLGGKLEREISLPALGTASGINGEKDDSTGFYSFTSFTYPPTIYEYNFNSNRSRVFRTAEVEFRPEEYATTRVFFTSKDGTRVPLFLVYRKGMQLSGSNPTLLYAYGGFNITTAPGFEPLHIPLLDQGFVYASANIRGGGEYGEKWHEAGTKLKKQNVFDDFIAAAEWLIENKYTSRDKLAIQGGSNGGLLVGAVMAQRPELFKVALPAVGVMDMLRYHKFTIGWNWAPDYGTSADSAEFQALYRYSPLHNIRDGVSYPATFATTADHDDRVVPAHSFKFIATLQEKQLGTNPVLIRVETRSGHGSSSTTKRLEVTADTYAFLMYNLGVRPRF